MNFWRLLLFPFSILYGVIVWLRNRFYDFGWFRSTRFNIPVIVVGNLEVGGSGKTPLTEYLVKLLTSYKTAVLSRGYGRKTKGFRWVDKNDDATLTGDEPLQIKNKFPELTVVVSEKRVEGLQRLQETGHEAVILDDAYQHRAVKPGLSILVFDYNRLQQPRLLLPAGNYRDSFAERKRADLILISKCPVNLSEEERNQISKKMALGPHQRIVFSAVKYSNRLDAVFQKDLYLKPEDISSSTEVLVITGIAKPELFIKHIQQYTKHIIHHNYPDHHLFSTKNMLKLVSDFEGLKTADKLIITTEKDAVRLTSNGNNKHLDKLPVFKWPIEIAFNQTDKDIFDQEILNYVKRTHRIS